MPRPLASLARLQQRGGCFRASCGHHSLAREAGGRSLRRRLGELKVRGQRRTSPISREGKEDRARMRTAAAAGRDRLLSRCCRSQTPRRPQGKCRQHDAVPGPHRDRRAAGTRAAADRRHASGRQRGAGGRRGSGNTPWPGLVLAVPLFAVRLARAAG